MHEMGGDAPVLNWSTAFNHWQFSPITTAIVAVLAVLYGWGVVRAGRSWPVRSTVNFGIGLAVIGVSLQSSIGFYEHDLFWVHMILHLLLIMVAPMFLVAGRPIGLLVAAGSTGVQRATKAAVRSKVGEAVTNPIAASVLYAAVVILTHLTGLMGTVMSSTAAMGIEAAVYVIAGYLYFLPVFGDEPIRWWLSYQARMLLVLLSMPVDTFTGVALMQSGHPMNGMSVHALNDGGAVMWIGGDFIMMVAIVLVFGMWSRSTSQRSGWLDAVRKQVLADRIGAQPDAAGEQTDIDEDERQLAAYNAWLAGLDKPSKR